MSDKKQLRMARREFFRLASGGALTLTSAEFLAGCGGSGNSAAVGGNGNTIGGPVDLNGTRTAVLNTFQLLDAKEDLGGLTNALQAHTDQAFADALAADDAVNRSLQAQGKSVPQTAQAQRTAMRTSHSGVGAATRSTLTRDPTPIVTVSPNGDIAVTVSTTMDGVAMTYEKTRKAIDDGIHIGFTEKGVGTASKTFSGTGGNFFTGAIPWTLTLNYSQDVTRVLQVEVCPDENGISHGLDNTTITMDCTAVGTASDGGAFSGNGSTEFQDLRSIVARVNDQAAIATLDNQHKSIYNKNIFIRHNGKVDTAVDDGVSITTDETGQTLDGKGYTTGGTRSPAQIDFIFSSKHHSPDDLLSFPILGTLIWGKLIDELNALAAKDPGPSSDVVEWLGKAQNHWQDGKCVTINLVSGGDQTTLSSGQHITIAVETRTVNDNSPVNALLESGTTGVQPPSQAGTPQASFDFTAPDVGTQEAAILNSAGIRIKSTSKRGIATASFPFKVQGGLVSLSFSEVTSQLTLRGSFGDQPGSVTVDGVKMPVISWTRNGIVCGPLPDTGKGSAGPVVVTFPDKSQTNAVNLSLYQGQFRYTVTDIGSLKYVITMNVFIRADVHGQSAGGTSVAVPSLIQVRRDSNAQFSASGAGDYVDNSGCAVHTLWSGTGNISNVIYPLPPPNTPYFSGLGELDLANNKLSLGLAVVYSKVLLEHTVRSCNGTDTFDFAADVDINPQFIDPNSIGFDFVLDAHRNIVGGTKAMDLSGGLNLTNQHITLEWDTITPQFGPTRATIVVPASRSQHPSRG